MWLIVSDLHDNTSCQCPPEHSGTDGLPLCMCMCVSVMFIKADMRRSGGTQPSVLLLTNIIYITETKRKRQRERETKTDGGRQSGSSEKEREREFHFNQGLGPLSCLANVRVCPGGWHNFADGFDPLRSCHVTH